MLTSSFKISLTTAGFRVLKLYYHRVGITILLNRIFLLLILYLADCFWVRTAFSFDFLKKKLKIQYFFLFIIVVKDKKLLEELLTSFLSTGIIVK